MWEYPGAVSPAIHAFEASGFHVVQTITWFVKTRQTFSSLSSRPASKHDIGILGIKGELPINKVEGELPPWDCKEVLQPHLKEAQKCSDRLPGMKPVDLLVPWIKWLVPKGGVVLDPFLGSGSTLLAAWKAHRRGIGIELIPERQNLIMDRLRAGQKRLDLAAWFEPNPVPEEMLHDF
jgi:DNA modification methylase